MTATISFAGEFGTEHGREHAKELVRLFCQRLACLDRPTDTMAGRITLVAHALIEWAYERNVRANNNPVFKGTGEYVQVVITTINASAVQLMVADCGGKELTTNHKEIREHADYLDYQLVNGGLLMRAVFRWRTCA